MSKKKIADSIIIRVGGGIREVQRQHVEITDNLDESFSHEPDLEQSEEMHPLGVEQESNKKIGPDKAIN